MFRLCLRMHVKVHVEIAKALFKKLCLPKEYENVFVKGITIPDEWRLKNPKRKHHYISSSVFEYIMQARFYYIRGDIPSCLFNLGIALHFVQDAHIPSPRTKFRRKIHAALERKIERLSIPQEEIATSFNLAHSSPEFVKEIISKIKWIYEPELALLKAVKASAAITAAVFGPKDPPKNLQTKYVIAKRNHRKYVVAGWATFLIGSILSLFLDPFIVPLMVFVFGIIGLVIVSRDKQFYELKEKAVWYGIEQKY